MLKWKDKTFVQKRQSLIEVAKKMELNPLKTAILDGISNEEEANGIRLMVLVSYEHLGPCDLRLKIKEELA